MSRARLKAYELVGPGAQWAAESGLKGADWYRTPLTRQRLKQLIRRSDRPSLINIGLWVGSMVVLASLAVVFWGTWIAWPLLLAYGVLYGSGSDSRSHEFAHGTPLRSRRMNEAMYQFASFLLLEDPTVNRWQHTLHHTDTLVVGSDPEIVVMRPARLTRIVANLFGLADLPRRLSLMILHSAGVTTAQEKVFVPETERPRVYLVARIWTAIFIATIVTCVVTDSILPILLIGGPRIYGAFMAIIYMITQHAGMGENVIDYRLNTRTVYMCRLNRFLYWNMNYHVEHHMYPMVPNYRLPELHNELKHDLAAPYPSLWAAYREIIPAIVRQLKDQSYYVRRELPPTANPYYGPLDVEVVLAREAS